MSSKQQHGSVAEQVDQTHSTEPTVQSSQEWVSAAADGEAISEQQLHQLCDNASLQQHYERYHLIGAALRNELAPKLPADFSASFAARLQQEPVHQLVVHRSFFHRIQQGMRQAANSEWLKPTAQTAIAASVALMAVLGVQYVQQPYEQELMSPLPVLHTQPVSGFATPVSLSQTTVDDRLEQHAHQAMLEQQRRLQDLLNAHHQQVRVLEQSALLNEQAPVVTEPEPDGNY